MLEEALLRAVVGGTGQARQVNQHGDLLCLALGREVEVEGHLAAGSGGIVAELEQLAAKGGDGSLGGDGHCGCCFGG